MKTLALGVVSALGCLAATAGAARADCGKVTITQMDWASAIVVTEVATFLMEQGYGCTVTRVPSATETALTSLAETKEPDIVTEIWLNNAPMLQGMIDSGKVEVLNDVISDGATEGWYVPKYLVEAHPEVASIDGILANPDLVGGRFYNCPDGWGCKTANDHLVQALDMKDAGIDVFVPGSPETLGASLGAAYQAKEPWFGYYWEPSSLLSRYPMVSVDMGPYIPEIHACNQRKDCPDPKLSAYPSTRVLTVVTEEFADREPEIVELMKKLGFTHEQMGEVLDWQESNSASGQEAAVHFLTTYKDVWSAWLDDNARTRLEALLK